MKPRLLDWLCCPTCRGPLELHAFARVPEPGDATGEDVDEGVLTCGCAAAFPVICGVPRMIEGSLSVQGAFRARWRQELAAAGADTPAALKGPSAEFRALIQPTLERFDKEWSEHSLEERTWGLEQETRLGHALHYLGWTREEAAGKVVLDAGCGTAKLTCGMATWGGEAVGLDLAPAAVRGWRQRSSLAGARGGHVHVVQGDVMRPPFRDAIFDGVHSSGVLHHTPDTRRALAAVGALVRPGGSLAVWLYHHGPPTRVPWLPFVRARWATVPESLLRPWTTRLPPRMLFALIHTYALVFHAFYSMGARFRGTRHEQTARERATSLFDSLAPPFVWRHRPDEVCAWFGELGFTAVQETSLPDDTAGFAVTGLRHKP